ncbi:PASTA domain-containing protein [Deinococcus sp. Arct2-2]|uniref:PASTA domain-containing protein n=1 Tax=Deinococcus sp. Arct2-2 TaxID=2568653 RepID=UPI0010A2F63D|nr:PASTA domain-containing protein [Deinococcus sp. Arct2-2]THF69377.1 PASTA domain-containing protein [Deinococcus sp. Arct2-2]
MTGPEPRTQSEIGTLPSPVVIDGKYEVVREVSREGNVTVSEVRAGEGVTRRVAWFDVTTPADRQGFHAYRTALRAVQPAGLTDVVARPGAYYAVWQPVAGMPLADLLAQPKKQEETVEALRELTANLAENGFALSDADVVLDGLEPRVAYLRPAPPTRTPEEVIALNQTTLAPLLGGKIKRKRQPGAWLTFIPGLLFLGGAGYLGAQAAQVYLNPPVREVSAVTGQNAQTAATALAKAGFQVEYTDGESAGLPVGAVIRQDPAAGTNLPVGRQVVLTVNNPPPLTVPRLEELTPDQARAALRDLSLVLGKVVKVDGSLTNTPEGRIIAQLPEPGSTMQRGQAVQIMVSTGVQGKETWIADLTGMTYAQAREHARAAGLVVTKVSQQASDRTENTVLEQTPAPYVRVSVGSPVTLTVATARYTAPSLPAGSLPLPPPYVPPVPVQPEVQPETPVPEPAQPDPTPEVVPDPVPEVTPDPATPDAEPVTPDSIPATPATDPATPDANAPASRNINFKYLFPADLPAGSYTIVVRDLDGEREILSATDSGQLAEATATKTDLAVRGDTVFIIRRDGQDYATVTP